MGYAFDYPAGWTATDFEAGDGVAVYLFSYDPSTVTGGEGIPEGQAKFDFLINPAYTYGTLDEWLAEYTAPMFNAPPGTTPEVQFIDQQRFVVEGGLEVVRVRVHSDYGGDGIAYLALINGRGLIIGVVADRTFMDDIVNSLRLAQ